MNQEFSVHRLNPEGLKKAEQIAEGFDALLTNILKLATPANAQTVVTKSREVSLLRTKLEEACFFAKKAIANLPENQKTNA